MIGHMKRVWISYLNFKEEGHPGNCKLGVQFLQEGERNSKTHVLEYDFSYKVWMTFLKWISVQLVFPANSSMSLLLISKLMRGRKGKKIVVRLLWKCIVWLLWKRKNALVFQNQQQQKERLVEDLKGRTWNYAIAKELVKDEINFEKWCNNPNCLSR